MRHLLDRLDQRYVKICAYASATVLLTLAAGMLLYYSSGFFSNLWLLICAVVEPAVYGILIGYLLNPAVVRVSRVLKHMGWRREDYQTRRLVAIVLCLLALAIGIVAIVLVMTLVITRSLNGVTFDSVQLMFSGAQGDIMRLVKTLQQRISEMNLFGSTSESGSGIVSSVASAFRSVADMGSTALFSVIFSIYLLVDGERVGNYALRLLQATVGERLTARIMSLLDDVDHVFSGYIRGQFMDALVVGLLSAVVLTLAGVPYGPVIGLLTGLGNLIPYVGAPLGIASTILVCLADGQPNKIILGIICLALIMFIDSNVINPKLLSDNIEVHPLLVVAALIAGGAVGGLAGMLVAVPAAAFLKLQIDRWIVRREAAKGESSDDTGHSSS